MTSGWEVRCPGSLLPHAGTAESLPWLTSTIRRYRENGHPVESLLAHSAKYVICRTCGKATVGRKDGTPRSHPPSKLGAEREARRRQRARTAIDQELADIRSAPERVADDLEALLSELGG